MRKKGPVSSTPVAPLTKARRRVLEAVAELAVDGPVLLSEVAAHVGGHPNTSRQQLDILTDDGLVSAEPMVRAGRGRRPLGFTVTATGRQALLGSSGAAERTELLKAFAAYLVTRPDPVAEARAVGQLWSAELDVGEPPQGHEGVDGVVELLEILGFDPTHTTTEQGEAVLLRSCPLLDLVHDESAVVCELHRGLIDGVLHRVGSTEGVELLPFATDDGCHVIRHPARGASPAGTRPSLGRTELAR